MDFFPKLTGYARDLLTRVNWTYVLAAAMIILGVLLLALLVYFIIKKRRGADGDQEQAKPDDEPKKKPKGMPVSSLVKIWKEFLREIPWSVRPNILAYEHFIVFGEAGSGKSVLIDHYTDWQGHARQFYPSYTTNPLLQIYLGSKVLVQEIPANLLSDTSEYARRAMVKLWKRLFRRTDPTVVIVLNAMELQSDEPEYLEYLKQKAQIIRGKINLLGHIRKRPIKVRIALTCMDQVEGFLEFSRFLSLSGIPLKLEYAADETTDISACLDPYEAYLTLALTSLPADKYLSAIAFVRQAPKLFQFLSVFIKFLQHPDPLSLEPEVTQLYLTSQEEGETPVLNPFSPTITTEEIQKLDPYFKHRVAAAAVGIGGLIFLGTAYLHERSLVTERFRTLAHTEISPPAKYEQKMHDILPLVYSQQHPLLGLLPDFFSEKNREITRRSMDNIRRIYLLPAIERISTEMTSKIVRTSASQPVTISAPEQQYRGKVEDTRDKAIYLLALIYATRDNELGKLVRGNVASWSQILNISKTLIEDYVSNNESTPRLSIDTGKLSLNQSKSVADDPRSWLVYFSEIGRLFQQPILSRPEFEKLQRETDHFAGEIQQMELFDLTVKIAELLKREAPPGLNLDAIARKESEIRQEPLKNFIKFIKNSNITYPEVTDSMGLVGLLENLKVMAGSKGTQGDTQYRFVFGGQEFKFNAQQWNDLLNRSRISLFLREFMNHYKRQDGLLFFPSDKEFNDLVMNSSNDGRFLFIGHARVDGRFTKEAVERRVRPILTELPAVVENLLIAPKDKADFVNFLFKEVDLYGRRYAQFYRKYYMEFDIKAGSPGALRFVLSQMILPSSPLREVLMTMRDNTQIDPGKNEYMQSFAMNLAEFEFIKRLTGEQKGTFPELDKYKGLLEQMQMDIQDQQGPPMKKDKDDPFALFKNRLTPLGRVSFAIYTGEKDSYLNLVKLWLDSVGVPRQWQDVFLAPVWQAYFLGMSEVETEIGKIWTELWQADIQPLYSKFPFDASAGEDVSVEIIKNATHPSGHFWSTYRATLAPFCPENGRLTQKKNGLFKAPKLPGNMLTTVSAITQISSVLWDKDGKERPLELTLKPGPLPSPIPGEPMAVLSYLHVGDANIFGLNQKASWKKIRFNWQNPSWASVGVEFISRDKSLRVKKTIEIPNSNWSFYRLLQKAKESAKTANGDYAKRAKSASGISRKTDDGFPIKWVINSPATNVEGRPMDIVFYIQSDPWAIFNLPR